MSHDYEPMREWHNTNIPCRHCGETELACRSVARFLDNNPPVRCSTAESGARCVLADGHALPHVLVEDAS